MNPTSCFTRQILLSEPAKWDLLLLALGGIDFWQSHGHTLSIDSSRVHSCASLVAPDGKALFKETWVDPWSVPGRGSHALSEGAWCPWGLSQTWNSSSSRFSVLCQQTFTILSSDNSKSTDSALAYSLWVSNAGCSINSHWVRNCRWIWKFPNMNLRSYLPTT